MTIVFILIVMIYDEKDQMEKDRNLWKFQLRVKSHVIPSQHHEESDLPAYQDIYERSFYL
jgi:hypothetical protein